MLSKLFKVTSFSALIITIYFGVLNAQVPSNLTWQTDKWEKGVDAAATYQANGQNYLLLSRSDAGKFWIFKLSADGNVGDLTWQTDKWEKGINTIAAYNYGGQNYLFLSRPDAGKAWVFQLSDAGGVGSMVWSTGNWEKGIKAASIYTAGGKSYLFLSRPDAGKAWIFALTDKGPEATAAPVQTSAAPKNDLNKILGVDYNIDPYFSRISYSDYSADNREKLLQSNLKDRKGAKQWTMIINIIKGTSDNKDVNVRKQVYAEILEAGVSEPDNFLEKALKGQVGKSLGKYVSGEKDVTAKASLEQIKSKF